MKRIIKGSEPRSLRQHRSTTHSTYDNYSEKDDLRDSLLQEQGHICCYCTQRVTKDDSKIAHWASRHYHQDHQLDYSNLLLACPGGQGSPRHLQHCDTHQQDKDITINPADRTRNCEDFIRYGSDGRIYSDDTIIDRDLDEILKLNLPTLKNNRRVVLDGAIEALRRKRPDGKWSRGFLEHAKWRWQSRDAGNRFQPYCQIVVSFIDKKISQL